MLSLRRNVLQLPRITSTARSSLPVLGAASWTHYVECTPDVIYGATERVPRSHGYSQAWKQSVVCWHLFSKYMRKYSISRSYTDKNKKQWLKCKTTWLLFLVNFCYSWCSSVNDTWEINQESLQLTPCPHKHRAVNYFRRTVRMGLESATRFSVCTLGGTWCGLMEQGYFLYKVPKNLYIF